MCAAVLQCDMCRGKPPLHTHQRSAELQWYDNCHELQDKHLALDVVICSGFCKQHASLLLGPHRTE